MQGLVLALLGDEGPRIPHVPGLGLVSQALHHLHTTHYHCMRWSSGLMAGARSWASLAGSAPPAHQIATLRKRMALGSETKYSLRQDSSHSRVTHLSSGLMPDAFLIVAAHIALGDYAHRTSCLWLCLHVLMCSSCCPAFSRPHLLHGQCNMVDDTHPDSPTQTVYLRSITFGFRAPVQTGSQQHGPHQLYNAARIT